MRVVTIQPGDSLYKIGKAYGLSVDQLVEANGIDPNKYLVIGDSLVIPSPEEKMPLEVNGYAYPFIDREVLRKTLPYLTYLSIFSYGVTDEGGLVPLRDDEPLIAMARSAGVAPMLVLTTVDESGGFNSQRSVNLLENADRRQRLADELKKVLEEKGYYGVDVDMEYIPGRLREDYTALVEFLKKELAPHPVFIALAPKTRRDQPGLLYEAHDYAGMGAAADRTLIMTYEWGYTYGPPMAVAPLPNVAQVMNFAVGEIPREKLLMGLPNYGYDWTLPYEQGRPARSIGNYEAVAIARKYGAEIQFDETAQSPWFRYYDARRQQHEVWFEDARSYQAKLGLVKELGIKGVSIWNIMRWFRPLYTLLDGYFDIIKVPQPR
ncbi:MAG: LysM peptidoglycan-binding domain-containing protein [Clostridia bacterium]|nr:LysM peptidoglycan-binding domain-containing protein [Clostridia bacterium]